MTVLIWRRGLAAAVQADASQKAGAEKPKTTQPGRIASCDEN
jgi:hypothetical protein